MCCYGRRHYSQSSSPRITFDTLEEYIAYLDGLEKIDVFSYRPLPTTFQNTPNFVTVVSKFPEVYSHIPQKYKKIKAVKKAAGIE